MSKKNNAIQSVTVAAREAGKALSRWTAVERAAQDAHMEGHGRALARALFAPDGSHHVLLKTGATTLEIKDGAIALSVAAKE